MAEGGIETKEETRQSQVEIVDIISEEYRVHWLQIEQLPKILKRGIYSPKFARRIGDIEYKPRRTSWDEHYVHTTEPFGSFGEDRVSVIFKGAKNRRRIAPRKFIGVCVWDNVFRLQELEDELRQREYTETLELVDQIRILLANAGIDLPIYGTSGDLYWPERMSHEEIVMLVEKKNEI